VECYYSRRSGGDDHPACGNDRGIPIYTYDVEQHVSFDEKSYISISDTRADDWTDILYRLAADTTSQLPLILGIVQVFLKVVTTLTFSIDACSAIEWLAVQESISPRRHSPLVIPVWTPAVVFHLSYSGSSSLDASSHTVISSQRSASETR
jgi:hypothetical protein